MKFKIKKQLLNEASGEGQQIPLFGNSPGAEKIKDQLGNVLSYKEDPDAFDSPPIRDAIIVKNFLKTADAAVASDLKTKFNTLDDAIAKVIEDYKAAKRTAATAKIDADTAAADKEKEAQQAPMKKAIRTLVLFALEPGGRTSIYKASNITGADEINYKFKNKKLIEYMDKVKEALKFVEEHELEILKEVELMEADDPYKNLVDSLFSNAGQLKELTDTIRWRIKSIEDAKARGEQEDADAKAEAEKFEKNKELLFKVLRFFQEKVGIESIRIPPADGEQRSKKKTVELVRELKKEFPTFDTLYNFLNKTIGAIIKKLVEYGAIQQTELDTPGADITFNTSISDIPMREASIRLYAELKTIGKKFRKTILKLLEFYGSFNIIYGIDPDITWKIEDPEGIKNLWRIIDTAVSESKKYKLKLIENKRG